MNRRVFLGAAGAVIFAPTFGRWFPLPKPRQLITLIGSDWQSVAYRHEAGGYIEHDWLFFRPVDAAGNPDQTKKPLFVAQLPQVIGAPALRLGPLMPVADGLNLDYAALPARYRAFAAAHQADWKPALGIGDTIRMTR